MIFERIVLPHPPHDVGDLQVGLGQWHFHGYAAEVLIHSVLLCSIFWTTDDWISFFDELSMPNDNLKSIRQKLCKDYSLLDRSTIDLQFLK